MKRVILLCVVVLLLSGCTTLKVTSDYSPNTDFTTLKTYGWLHDIDQPSENVRVNNDLVRTTVREAVEEALAEKGFVKTDRDSADFVITWFGAIETKLKAENINHFYAPYGYGTLYRDPYWNSNPSIASTTEYEEGSLLFDFLDPKRQSLIWRGQGRDKIVEGEPDDVVRKNLKAAVKSILADFPPN